MALDEQTALADSRHLLAEWMGSVSPRFSRPPKDALADLVVEYGRHRMIVEFKNTTSSAALSAAVEVVKQATQRERHARPVVAVPYMGEIGKRLCAEADVSWFDLSGNAVSGNADIDAPGLRVLIEGKPNRWGDVGGRLRDIEADFAAVIAPGWAPCGNRRNLAQSLPSRSTARPQAARSVLHDRRAALP